MVAHILRRRPLTSIAQGNIEGLITAKHQARAKMPPASRFGDGLEDGLHVAELRAIEPATQDFGTVVTPVSGGISQIEPAILRKTGMQGDAQQSALPFFPGF